MGNRSVVPFGPQHPVLPEPIHLDLVLEDEKVLAAIPSIGFIHRGLESLASKKDFNEMVYVAERICGICSFMHGMGYCMALEDIMNVEVPRRADYLRTIWAEMSRLHSHLLWLGLLADGFGFESLFMHSWRLRESILDMFEESTGGRVIFSVNTIGGVLKDMPNEAFGVFNKHSFETNVLNNIKGNLRKHAFGAFSEDMEQKANRRVQISMKELDGCWTIYIRNNGEPFPATANISEIWDYGRSFGRQASEEGGTGMFYIKDTVEHFGGTVDFVPLFMGDFTVEYRITIKK